MNVKSLTEVAETYFNNLNPIAERISVDICTTKEAYENLWHCLSQREKEQIIDETLIYPEVVLKYALTLNSLEAELLQCGKKLIVDENTGHSWRDEHSAPFSWKTPSQLNLSLFGTSDDTSPKKHLYLNKVLSSHNDTNEKEKNGSLHVQFENKINSAYNEKTSNDAPDCPSLVLGGTAAKGIRAKLSFIPTKNFGSEMKNLISFSNFSNNAHSDDSSNILAKLKTNTMMKIQNRIKSVGGKNSIVERKSNSVDHAEVECLVQQKTVTISKLQKPSPKSVSKPKSPPPPPPPLRKTEKTKQPNVSEVNNERSKMILVKKNKPNDSKTDSEKAGLLDSSPVRSFKTDVSKESDENVGLIRDVSYISKDISVEADSSNSESNGLSSHSTKESGFTVSQSNSYVDVIPKSGFDFLDNW